MDSYSALIGFLSFLLCQEMCKSQLQANLACLRQLNRQNDMIRDWNMAMDR